MFVKTVAALALAGASLAAPASAPIAYFTNIPAIVKLKCGKASGTAFRTGTGALTSVSHVTQYGPCTVDGEPVVVTYADSNLDFASIRTVVQGRGLVINCDGYRNGELYLATGHARGLPEQRAMVVQASDEATRHLSWRGLYVLVGDRFIPGMSGGAVFNRAGEVVGLVNGYNVLVPISYSRPLSETPLCR